MKIRVATYNIHKGMSYRSQPRVHALKQAIGKFDADVVFLQEVQGKHDRIAEKFGKRPMATATGPPRRSTSSSATAATPCTA